MSHSYTTLLIYVLKESFGEIVRRTAEALIRHGPLLLSGIVFKSRLPLQLVKESLKVLIQHNIVTFSCRPVNFDALYEFHASVVLSMFNQYKYCSFANRKFGSEGRIILATIIRSGQISISKMLFIIGSCNFSEDSNKTIADVLDFLKKYQTIFSELVKLEYVIRCGHVISPESAEVPEFEKVNPMSEFCNQPTKIPLKIIADGIVENFTVSKFSNEDDKILWKVNTSAFEPLIREDILVEAIIERTQEEIIGKVFRAILSRGFDKNPYSHSTRSVSIAEIRKSIVEEAYDDEVEVLAELEESLQYLMADPLPILTKGGSTTGGHYVINVKETIRLLTVGIVDRIMECRFGQLGARIFRIIRQSGYIEQDKLIQKAMVSTKIGKSVLYRLLENNCIVLKEIRKNYSIASSINNKAVVFLFRVDLDVILRSLLEESYRGIVNAKIRFAAENRKHCRLLTKETRINKILHNMKKSRCSEEQLTEVRDMLTYPERKILRKVQEGLEKLQSAQLHCYRSLFIIRTYFEFMEIDVRKV